MIAPRLLFRYRDLNKQAVNLFDETDPKKRLKILDEIETQDKKITKVEAFLKTAGNFLGLIGTAAFAGAAFLSSPLIPVVTGMACLVGAITAISSANTLDDQRNQSQSDAIRRILYKQKQKGYELGKFKAAKKEKHKLAQSNRWEFLAAKDLIDDIAEAPANDVKKSTEILEQSAKADQDKTKAGTYFKNAGYVLALLGTVSFAMTSLAIAPFALLVIAGAALYNTALICVSLGGILEANRNQNQSIGLRRILIGEEGLIQKAQSTTDLKRGDQAIWGSKIKDEKNQRALAYR